jgi:hypothetical protein
VEDIDHTRTKAKIPQTNGICERFHKTVLNEFYRVAFRKRSTKQSKNYKTIWTPGLSCTMKNDLIRADGAYGKTPLQTFVDSIALAKQKMIAA